MQHSLQTCFNRLRSQQLPPLMRVLLCLVLLALGPVALAADWVPVLRQGNQQELTRLGGQAGASGLAVELASAERQQVLAALHAAQGAEDSWALLGNLAKNASHPDRSIAILAAEIAAEISHGFDSFTIEEQEVSTQKLLEWRLAWLKTAAASERWVDIRVHAFDVAVRLHQLTPKSSRPEFPLEQFSKDPDEEMRATLLEVAPTSPELQSLVKTLLTSDPSRRVALSAAQRFCGPLGNTDSTFREALDPETLKRLQTLANATEFAIESRVDLANCLVTDTSSESRRTLSALQQQSHPALRKDLVALLRATAP